jgi:hypothetical protein
MKNVVIFDDVEQAGEAPASRGHSSTLSQPMALSADGKHLAYVIRDSGDSRVVLDAVPGPTFTRILAGPIFLPNGKLQYIARKELDYFRVTQTP